VLEFLIQRAAISIATLFVISLIVFTGVRLIPGDPARVMAGTDASMAPGFETPEAMVNSLAADDYWAKH